MAQPDERPPEEIGLDLAGSSASLRRWRAGQAESVYRVVMASMEHLRPWMVWVAGYDRAAAGRFLAQCEHDWEEGAAFNYAITTGGAVVGSCGLMRRIGPGGLEVGYWLHPAHTGRGLATAAAGALVEAALGLQDIERVELVHDQVNEASGAIARRLGFTEIERRPVTGEARILGEVEVVWRLGRPAAAP